MPDKSTWGKGIISFFIKKETLTPLCWWSRTGADQKGSCASSPEVQVDVCRLERFKPLWERRSQKEKLITRIWIPWDLFNGNKSVVAPAPQGNSRPKFTDLSILWIIYQSSFQDFYTSSMKEKLQRLAKQRSPKYLSAVSRSPCIYSVRHGEGIDWYRDQTPSCRRVILYRNMEQMAS